MNQQRWRKSGIQGWNNLCSRILYRLGYRQLIVLRRGLDHSIPEIRIGIAVTMDWLRTDQSEEYRAYRKARSNLDPRTLLAAGDRCLVARHEGRMVASMWGSNGRGSSRWFGGTIPVGIDEAYRFDSYTLPEMRGKSINLALTLAWFAQWRAEGVTAVIATTLPENTASLRALSKAGFEEISLLRAFQCGPWRWEWPPR